MQPRDEFGCSYGYFSSNRASAKTTSYGAAVNPTRMLFLTLSADSDLSLPPSYLHIILNSSLTAPPLDSCFFRVRSRLLRLPTHVIIGKQHHQQRLSIPDNSECKSSDLGFIAGRSVWEVREATTRLSKVDAGNYARVERINALLPSTSPFIIGGSFLEVSSSPPRF